MEDSFKWTDELVLLALDLAHYNGYHKFPQGCVDVFDEVKNQAMRSGYQFPKWISDHIQSKQQSVENKDYEIMEETFTGRDDDGSDWWTSHPLIKTVRRKSDNETFAINELTQYGSKIQSFEETKFGLLANMGSFKVPLEDLVKRKNDNKDWEIVERFTYGEVACDGDLSPIKSVRRLSDNEVFTVGDKILNKNGSYFDGVIDNFSITGNDLWANVKDKFSGHQNHISNIVKANQKQTLFTTEDGKDIFEGDKYWWVDEEKWRCVEWIAISHDNIDSVKAFSTEQVAKDYILMNKKQFSVSEINETIREGLNRTSIINLAGWLTYYFYDMARQKIKSKE